VVKNSMLEILHTLILGVISWFMIASLVLPLMGLLWSYVRQFLSVTSSTMYFKD